MSRPLIAALILAPALAYGWPSGTQFDDDALGMDGGGGISFTGSPRLAGRDCANCHLDPPREIGVSILADPSDIFTVGYEPGRQYRFRVILTNEHEYPQGRSLGNACGTQVKPYVPCDDNGFSLEIDDQGGNPSGTFEGAVNGLCTANPPLDADTYVLADGTAVLSGPLHGLIAWEFCWTAPPETNGPLGPMKAYVGVVDGNGGDGTSDNPNDVIGDDVFSGILPIQERNPNGKPAVAPPQTGGCAVALGGGTVGVGAIVLVLALIWRRRALLALLVIGGACTTVKPWQKETLAKKIMQLSPDPNEDELDIHMHEAREGSSGAQGSGGGGCGCN